MFAVLCVRRNVLKNLPSAFPSRFMTVAAAAAAAAGVEGDISGVGDAEQRESTVELRSRSCADKNITAVRIGITLK